MDCAGMRSTLRISVVQYEDGRSSARPLTTSAGVAPMAHRHIVAHEQLELPLFDTIRIPLTQGYTTIIDAADGDLAQRCWHVEQYGSCFYARHTGPRSSGRKKTRLHRVVMERILGRPLRSSENVDHINGDSLDNRRANLRLATPTENARNARRSAANTSGYKGVTRCRRNGKWEAQIRIDGRNKFLGYFDDLEQAHAAYCEAAIHHFGEFARFE